MRRSGSGGLILPVQETVSSARRGFPQAAYHAKVAQVTKWTSVLMHGVGNAVAWALIQNDLVTIEYKVLANIAPEGVFMMVLWAVMGWVVMKGSAPARLE